MAWAAEQLAPTYMTVERSTGRYVVVEDEVVAGTVMCAGAHLHPS